ncbi:MAG: hypothetical protein A2293_15175 [Elusimicrobia bacterium RIFOXYB2_FULL_49_7]|nr:MAG: hypothetical protein A2293_15175 [Elusimicrobia bacterium RIFOXYB2_FULL_49_7]
MTKKQTPFMICLSVVIAYTLFFTLLSIKRYTAFNTDLDLGNILQAFYNTLHGRFMEMTMNNGNVCRWAGHTEFIFLLLIPIFALFPFAETLLFLQSAALSGAALALFFLARHRLKDDWTALFLALSFLCLPFLHPLNLSDFHSDPFMILPQLLAWLFLKKGRIRFFWLCILLATLCKEYVSLVNLLLGLLILKNHRQQGIQLILLALAQYFLITPLAFRFFGSPTLHLAGESHALVIPTDFSATSLMAPFQSAFQTLFTRDSFIKTLFLLIILNHSLLRFPRGVLLILPLFVALLFLGHQTLFSNHRHALFLAPLFIVCVEGLRGLDTMQMRKRVIRLTLLPALLVSLLYPGTIIGGNLSELFFHPEYRNVFHYHYTPHDHIADSLLKTLPTDISIASDNALRTKLVDREQAFLHPFPTRLSGTDCYLFDFFETLSHVPFEVRRSRCSELLSSEEFYVTSFTDGLLIFKKGRPPRTPFSLKRLDKAPLSTDTTADWQWLKSELETVPEGFILRTQFWKGRSSAKGDAFISLWMGKEDTVRMLHLPLLLAPLSSLEKGAYEESCFFQCPTGQRFEEKEHRIGLYRQDAYLPFMSRPTLRVGLLQTVGSAISAVPYCPKSSGKP